MQKRFETVDIILAAYLKINGYKLVEIMKQGNRGTFVFEGVPQSVITEYDLGSAKVEPRALNSEIRALTTAARR